MGSFSSMSYLVCIFEQKAMHWFVVCGNICLFARSFILICHCAHVVIKCLKNVQHYWGILVCYNEFILCCDSILKHTLCFLSAISKNYRCIMIIYIMN